MSKPVRIVVFVVTIVAAMAMTACQGSAPTRLYTLAPMPSAAAIPSTYSGPPVQVRAVHVPPDLDRTEFLRETSPGQWAVAEQDQWAAPLSRLIRQTLTEDLASRLPAGTVLFPNAPARADVDGVAVDILSLRFSQGQATLQVSWSTGGPHAAQLTLSAPIGNATALETSRAWNQLLGQLADHIATDLSH